MIRDTIWKLVDAAFTFLGKISIPLAFRSATRVGRIAAALGIFGVRPRQIGDLFGVESPKERAEIARRASGCALARHVIARAVETHGFEALFPLVELESTETLREILERRRGLVLATIHAGSIPGLSAWLEVSGIDYAAFRKHTLVRAGDSMDPPPPSASQRAAGIRVALEHLRAGKAVCIAIDEVEATGRFKVDFFGKRVVFMPGVPALARSSGAPIHTVVASWNSDTSKFRVDISDEIRTDDLAPDDPDAFDHRVLQRLATHFEAILGQRPELLAYEIEALLAQPPATATHLLEPA